MQSFIILTLGILLALLAYAVSISVGAAIVALISYLVGISSSWSVCYGVSVGLHLLQYCFRK